MVEQCFQIILTQNHKHLVLNIIMYNLELQNRENDEEKAVKLGKKNHMYYITERGNCVRYFVHCVCKRLLIIFTQKYN